MKQTLNYTTSQINKDYLIKVNGTTEDGRKLNTLVGVSGLLELIGIERANKFLDRAYNCLTDCCTCKVYGGLKVSFYIH